MKLSQIIYVSFSLKFQFKSYFRQYIYFLLHSTSEKAAAHPFLFPKQECAQLQNIAKETDREKGDIRTKSKNKGEYVSLSTALLTLCARDLIGSDLGVEPGFQFLLDVTWHNFVLEQAHRVVGSALGHRSQSRHVLEHLGKGHQGFNSLDWTTFAQVQHLATSRVDITQHITHRLLRSDHIDLHDRFHQSGTSLPQTFLHGSASGNFKRQNRRIDIVVGTIDQSGSDSQHRETGNNTVAELAFQTLLHTWNEFLGDGTTLDLVDKFKGRLERVFLGDRLKLDLNASILTRATRLLLVGVIHFRHAGDGLTVGDLRSTHIAFHLELSLHTIDNDFQMQLTHTFNNGLVGLLISGESERRIFLSKLGQGDSHLLVIGLGLGLHSDLDNWFWEVHSFEDDRLLQVTQRLSRDGILQADQRDNITCASRLDFLSLVGVHEQHTTNSLLLALNRVVDRAAALQSARVDTSKRQGSDEWIGSDLERQSGEWLAVGRCTVHLLVIPNTLDGWDVVGSWQVVDDGVKERLDTLVLERGTADDRDKLQADGTLSDALLEGFLVWVLSFEVVQERLLILFDGLLNEHVVVLLREFLHVIRNLLFDKLGTESLLEPNNCLHLDEIDDSLEL
mmetsp:Transcript_14496/g.24999  ORF Transcript_14496/g.24999 Transcript_14496/m.24999 type:complete len:620 (+) Transcript_14496:1166-3025(+)